MSNITAKTPWKEHLGEVPLHITYFDGTLTEAVERMERQYPHYAALSFMGKIVNYRETVRRIEECARAMRAIGISENDRVTIALPNCPQAVYAFYAVNLIGAVANMIHPLSAEEEIAFYLKEADSTAIVTLDQFYEKVAHIRAETKLRHVIVASIADELRFPLNLGYALTEGRKTPKLPAEATIFRWKEFLRAGAAFDGDVRAKRGADDAAVILYSGGTTGTTKGVVLSNLNINALAQQVMAANRMAIPGDKMLAAMPMFHGFGLGVCIHTALSHGGCSVLIPRFTAGSYAKQIVKTKCNFIAGVPTLYEALLHMPCMQDADLSFLKGVFSGGDGLTVELKKKLDGFLAAHHAPVPVREGYGTTETVTACCLTPPHMHKEGSIGLPFPDTYIKIVEPGTEQELPYGETGEILLAGPTVMKGYLHHEEETAQMLYRHADGLTWLRTGDLGRMDEDGFIYFSGRMKRMIVTSGYNVYPGQIENILDANELVQMSCVIGLPDDYKVQRIKAFVTLRAGVPENEETRRAILDYCAKKVAKYAMPASIEFRSEMPKTLVGKVAYRKLEEEELAKLAEKKEQEKQMKGGISDGTV